ncbi:hypothetical protein SUGI_0268790 [Cryptomeria japonica]|nr:hypothetical protein SUGI_0268790 [Cryptomeria japonica]
MVIAGKIGGLVNLSTPRHCGSSWKMMRASGEGLPSHKTCEGKQRELRAREKRRGKPSLPSCGSRGGIQCASCGKEGCTCISTPPSRTITMANEKRCGVRFQETEMR